MWTFSPESTCNAENYLIYTNVSLIYDSREGKIMLTKYSCQLSTINTNYFILPNIKIAKVKLIAKKKNKGTQ